MTNPLAYDETLKRWVWKGSFAERLLPMNAGFEWDKARKVWYTRNPAHADKLAEYADSKASAQLGELRQSRQEALDASAATDADISIPAPAGLAYLPYQKAGVAYALRAFGDYQTQKGGTGLSARGVLIADEMGL
jgi:SWI/SNF-related matrix-associated actin-dependent regulator 1 of chromatin subfamily A